MAVGRGRPALCGSPSGAAARLHGFGDLALDRQDAGEAARLYRESLEIGLQLRDELQIAYCLAGLAAVDAQEGRVGQAARLWGSVVGFERTSGTPLNDSERQRYARARRRRAQTGHVDGVRGGARR